MEDELRYLEEEESEDDGVDPIFKKPVAYSLSRDGKTNQNAIKTRDFSYKNDNFISLEDYRSNGGYDLLKKLQEGTVTFDQFIKVVEANTKTKEDLEEFANDLIKQELTGGADEFVDGPVCLQRLSKNKLDDYRDRFIYNYMVFAKKKYPDNSIEHFRRSANLDQLLSHLYML